MTMKALITENEIENIAISYLQGLGYDYKHGVEISPDGDHPERLYSEVVLVTRLRDAIDKLNPNITQEAREDALKKVLRTESPNLIINNENFHRYLTDGVDVEIRRESSIRGEKVYIVDFENPDNNEFLAVNQFTVIEGNQNKRPDIVLFVNGLPLVVIELKNAVDENADIKSAYNQLQTYKQAVPSLFTYNELLIISDGWDAKCGTLTSDYGRFMAWRTKDGKAEATHLELPMEVMFLGMLNKKTLFDLIRQFIVFEKSDGKTLKKVAAYHQYYAVNKAVESCIRAAGYVPLDRLRERGSRGAEPVIDSIADPFAELVEAPGDRRGGVVWHTQGSGKSLSMVFFSGKLIMEPQMENPTLVVLTDRNDLDEQLFQTFTNCQQLLRQQPQQAETRKGLKELLTVASGGIVFTTIQKFMPETDDDVEIQDGVLREPSVRYLGAKVKPKIGRAHV